MLKSASKKANLLTHNSNQMTPEQSKQFNEIFDELGKSLDITPAQYKVAVTSYQFVECQRRFRSGEPVTYKLVAGNGYLVLSRGNV